MVFEGPCIACALAAFAFAFFSLYFWVFSAFFRSFSGSLGAAAGPLATGGGDFEDIVRARLHSARRIITMIGDEAL